MHGRATDRYTHFALECLCCEKCFKIKILDPSGAIREVCMHQMKKSAFNPNDLNIRLVMHNALMRNTKQAIGFWRTWFGGGLWKAIWHWESKSWFNSVSRLNCYTCCL